MIRRPILIVYVLTLILFVVYSYTQIDLNLTLSSNPLYQQIQSSLIHIGYYNRPWSTVYYLLLLLSLFSFYIFFIRLAMKGKIAPKNFWRLTFFSLFILLFSYPAFSHDIFNYLFDARIVTKYNLSPYYFNALDFPDDVWTRFMHWTHRYYPYGPLWLYLSIPLSYAGFGKFIPTLFIFKLMFFLCTLGNIWLIGTLLGSVSQKQKIIAMVLFAFNPLVQIESIVSPHNESVMLFFTLLGFTCLEKRKKLFGAISLLASIGLKFLPIIYLPFIFIRSSINNVRVYTTLIILTLISLVPVIILREPYPWYFIPLIGLLSLHLNMFSIMATLGLSVGALLRYGPYLYFGDYKSPVPEIQNGAFFLSLIVAIIGLLIGLKKRTYV